MSALSMPVQAKASPWVTTVLELIDGVIQDRVLVYGSLPPEGGDLDLLARPAELAAIRDILSAAGFVPVRRMLVRVCQGSREMVELTPASAWQLPQNELESLFAESRSIDGVNRLVRPSAHHALLIHARKMMRRHTSPHKLRSRVEAQLTAEPEAWQRAGERAKVWRAKRALAALKAAYKGDGYVPLLALLSALAEQLGNHEAGTIRGRVGLLRALLRHRFLARMRRTRVIAFSGLDGSGKSTQARLLRDALMATGQDAIVLWAGIGANRSLGSIKAPVKRFLRTLPPVGPFREVVERVMPKPGGTPTPLAEPGKRNADHGVALTMVIQVWMVVMALSNVFTTRKVLLRSLGRRRIVIFDRYTLDSAVRLRHWYGDGLATKLVIWLIHLTAKRPVKAYFLDVPPDVAFARKPEWELDDLECRATLYRDEYAQLGVRRLDGSRLAEDLFAEIVADVRNALD